MTASTETSRTPLIELQGVTKVYDGAGALNGVLEKRLAKDAKPDEAAQVQA